jgi:hypothetical protein
LEINDSSADSDDDNEEEDVTEAEAMETAAITLAGGGRRESFMDLLAFVMRKKVLIVPLVGYFVLKKIQKRTI